MTNWYWILAFWIIGSLLAFALTEHYGAFRYEVFDTRFNLVVERRWSWAWLLNLVGSWIMVLVIWQASHESDEQQSPGDADIRA